MMRKTPPKYRGYMTHVYVPHIQFLRKFTNGHGYDTLAYIFRNATICHIKYDGFYMDNTDIIQGLRK